MTMHPKLGSMNNYDDTLEFTLESLELSFANALRRTILSDIPVYKELFSKIAIFCSLKKIQLLSQLLEEQMITDNVFFNFNDYKSISHLTWENTSKLISNIYNE